MSSSTPSTPDFSSSVVREDTIEYGFIGTLQKLKYEYCPDITNRATLEANFREKFEALNRVRLTDAGNGYNKTLLCFMQLFIVSNRDCPYYFANNNARHFAFNADELVNSSRLFAGETEISLIA